jgi:hypothetical protein
MVEPYLEQGGRVIVFESAQADTFLEEEIEKEVVDETELGFKTEKKKCLIPGLEHPHSLCILQRDVAD